MFATLPTFFAGVPAADSEPGYPPRVRVGLVYRDDRRPGRFEWVLVIQGKN